MKGMMRIHTRLGASIALTVLSLTTIFYLLPNSSVGERLQRIALGGTSIRGSGSGSGSGGSSGDGGGGFWGWGSSGDDDALRVVVFGDSWADVPADEAKLGRGRSWAGVMCEEVNCTSHLTFAASQPSSEYPASPPTGGLTSNAIYTNALHDAGVADVSWDLLLPDLAAQIMEYLETTKSGKQPREVIFALSFGFWDIFHFASVDYELAQRMVDSSVDELVRQVAILYKSYTPNREHDPEPSLDPDAPPPRPAAFRIAIPRVFDPSLVPGWLNQRSVPLFPSTVAEEQKHAVYLTERWNSRLENNLGAWIAEEEKDDKPPQEQELKHDDGEQPPPSPPATRRSDETAPPPVPKDVFFYDLPRYILDSMVEQHLQDKGLSDGLGVGKGESPFENVSQPCVSSSSSSSSPEPESNIHITAKKQRDQELHGKTLCNDPASYLFWDDFHIGAVANDGLGKAIAHVIRDGGRMGGLQ